MIGCLLQKCILGLIVDFLQFLHWWDDWEHSFVVMNFEVLVSWIYFLLVLKQLLCEHPRSSSQYPLHIHVLTHKRSLCVSHLLQSCHWELFQSDSSPPLTASSSGISALRAAEATSSLPAVSSPPVASASGTAGPPVRASHKARCCPWDGKTAAVCHAARISPMLLMGMLLKWWCSELGPMLQFYTLLHHIKLFLLEFWF